MAQNEREQRRGTHLLPWAIAVLFLVSCGPSQTGVPIIAVGPPSGVSEKPTAGVTSEPVTPTATALPTATSFPVATLLAQTRTAVKNSGAETSFVEQGAWTKEVFNDLQRSLFAIQFRLPELRKQEGTSGMLLKSPDGRKYYLLTSAHGELKSLPTEVQLFRPGIDNGPYIIHPTDYVQNAPERLGQSVVIFTGDAKELVRLGLNAQSGFGWRDNFPVNDQFLDRRVLFAGVPLVFSGDNGRFYPGTITLATVAPVGDIVAKSKDTLILRGEASPGNSGGPLFGLDYSRRREGEVVVLGVVTGADPERRIVEIATPSLSGLMRIFDLHR